MATIFLQLIRQIYNADGFEGTFSYADAATAAEAFGNDCFVSFNFDGFHSTTYHRAEVNAE